MKFLGLIFCFFHLLAVQAQDALTLVFDLPSGHMESPDSLHIQSPCKSCEVYFSTDGSLPIQGGDPYKQALWIDQSTLVLARAFHPVKGWGPLFHQLYYFEPESTIPVVSLACSPADLFDPLKGLYEKGPKAKDKYPFFGANFWSDRELFTHVLWLEDGRPTLAQGAGLKMFGGFSRAAAQKSFSLHARSRYGPKKFHAPIFPQRSFEKYEKLVLRNGGSDFGQAYIRDALTSTLLLGSGLDVQAAIPVRVYVNGWYFGLYYLREKLGVDYLMQHRPKETQWDWDLLEKDELVIRGNRQAYDSLMQVLEQLDLSKPNHFAQFEAAVDVENFALYQAVQAYIDNLDAAGNIKYYRSKKPGSSWRWMLYDTDFGWNKHHSQAHMQPSLERMTQADGPIWPNPPWSTFLLRKAFESKQFQELFVRKAQHLMWHYFHPDRLMQTLDSLESHLNSELDLSIERWNQSVARKNRHWKRIRNFAMQRPRWFMEHMQKFFNLPPIQEVQLHAGVQTIFVDGLSFSGTRLLQGFEGDSLWLEAKLDSNWRWLGWTDGVKDNPRRFVFKQAFAELGPKVVRQTLSPYRHQIIISQLHQDSSGLNKLVLKNIGESVVQLEGFSIWLGGKRMVIDFHQALLPDQVFEWRIMGSESLPVSEHLYLMDEKWQKVDQFYFSPYWKQRVALRYGGLEEGAWHYQNESPAAEAELLQVHPDRDEGPLPWFWYALFVALLAALIYVFHGMLSESHS